jgi:acyl-CoA reductase-like NAD-dependent aldehyde dehydrogenase
MMFIGGRWVPSSSGTTYPVLNPAVGQVLANVSRGTEDDSRLAVETAKKAFDSPAWRGLDPSRRGRILFKISQLLRERLSDFAKLETLNNGKPLGQAKGDVAMAARQFEYFAGMADKIQGATIPIPGNRLDYTLKEPLGVTAHIVPWNYPLAMAARSIAPALAAGNAVVAKPASATPLTLLKLAELCKEGGLPDGLFNVVTGGGQEIGESLVRNPDVKLVTVTGSVETGTRVMELASANLAKVVLELGGKNPNIVFGDADVGKAAEGVLNGAFTNAGQMCWAGSRLLVEATIAQKLIDLVVAGAKALRLGDGLEPDTRMGPLISDSHRRRVAGFVTGGMDDGASVLAGGGTPDAGALANGFFYEPTVLGNVSPEMKVSKEEIFGPVLTITTFETDEEARKLANGVDYGLWAGIWTRDLRRAHTVAQQLEAGIVAVNEEPITFPQTPFGGYKKSGNCTEQGMDAISSYLRVKNVSINLS